MKLLVGSLLISTITSFGVLSPSSMVKTPNQKKESDCLVQGLDSVAQNTVVQVLFY
jgi:hypothetical protein